MTYPDILGLLVAYLDTTHAEPVVTRVPNPRPATFTQVRIVGGAQQRPVREVTRVDVFSWAATEQDGWTLAEQTRREIHALAKTTSLGSGVVCYRVDETMRPRQLDDPETGTPRWWATYALMTRANDAIA
jgi:hypothetical protein